MSIPNVNQAWSSQPQLTNVSGVTYMCMLGQTGGTTDNYLITVEDFLKGSIIGVTGTTNFLVANGSLISTTQTGATIGTNGGVAKITPDLFSVNGGDTLSINGTTNFSVANGSLISTTQTGATIGNNGGVTKITPDLFSVNGGSLFSATQTGATIGTNGDVAKITPDSFSINGGSLISATQNSVYIGNIMDIHGNIVSLNDDLLRVEHDSYSYNRLYAGIDYGDGKRSLINIIEHDSIVDSDILELGVSGRTLSVTGTTNFKVGNSSLIDLYYYSGDYDNRTLNIGDGELIYMYKDQNGGRYCVIDNNSGQRALNTYISTGGTNCFISDSLISAESGNNNNFKVKTKDNFYLINIDNGDGETGSTYAGTIGQYQFSSTPETESQKLGSLLELTHNPGTTSCNIGANGSLLHIDTASNKVILNNTTGSTTSNTILLGNSDITAVNAYANFTNISDERDKKDISTIPSSIDFVNQLKPVKFTWNIRGGGRTDKEVGFIAQELQKAQEDLNFDIPGLVKEISEDRLGVSYTLLIPVLTKAIQELSKSNEELKERIIALESKLK